MSRAVIGHLAIARAGGDRAHLQLRALAWEDTLKTLAAAWKIDLEKLPVQRSAPDKVKLAAAMKRATSVSNGWLAERLAMGPAASASQYVTPSDRLPGLTRS